MLRLLAHFLTPTISSLQQASAFAMLSLTAACSLTPQPTLTTVDALAEVRAQDCEAWPYTGYSISIPDDGVQQLGEDTPLTVRGNQANNTARDATCGVPP